MRHFVITVALLTLTVIHPQTHGARTTLSHDTYVYKNVDNLDVEADVYGGDPDIIKPVLVYIHGGALIAGTRKMIRTEQLQAYLDAGFVVISIDYRLAPEVKLPQITGDIKDAFAWITKAGPTLFGADPERISVVGQSAGGYLTLLSGHFIKPRPKALISYYGYGDIIGPWYSEPDPHYCKEPAVSEEESGKHVDTPVVANRSFSDNPKAKFYLWCRQNGRWPIEVGGVDPAKNPDFFTPYMPLLNIDKRYPPTFLIHGDKDTDVPYEQSVLMAEALENKGVEYEFITIKDGAHGFDWQKDDPQVVAGFAKILAFLEKHGK